MLNSGARSLGAAIFAIWGDLRTAGRSYINRACAYGYTPDRRLIELPLAAPRRPDPKADMVRRVATRPPVHLAGRRAVARRAGRWGLAGAHYYLPDLTSSAYRRAPSFGKSP